MAINALLARQGAVLGSALIYWTGVIMHARHLRKQIGRSPNIKPRGLKEMLLWFGWFIVIVGWIGQPFIIRSSDSAVLFSPAKFLLRFFSVFVGVFIALCGHIGTLWCYSALGDSWRIGIKRNERTTLVMRGPYLLVRHPLYLFQIMILVGMLLLLPTPFSFLIFLLHFICVILKSLDEELYLTGIHGRQYADYLLRTGKFFPRWKSLLGIYRGPK